MEFPVMTHNWFIWFLYLKEKHDIISVKINFYDAHVQHLSKWNIKKVLNLWGDLAKQAHWFHKVSSPCYTTYCTLFYVKMSVWQIKSNSTPNDSSCSCIKFYILESLTCFKGAEVTEKYSISSPTRKIDSAVFVFYFHSACAVSCLATI